MTAARSVAVTTEAAWQEQFLEAAHLLGWRHMHVRRSIGKRGHWTTATNVDGWPDLTLWSERQQRLVFVELKTETGRVSAAQWLVHYSLQAAGQDLRVLRPSDLEDAVAWLRGTP